MAHSSDTHHVTAPCLPWHAAPAQVSALACAAQRGDDVQVAALLTSGTVRLQEKHFALQLAAVNGHVACVRVIVGALSRNELQNARHYGGPLELAAANGHERIVNLLVARGGTDVLSLIVGCRAACAAARKGHCGVLAQFERSVVPVCGTKYFDETAAHAAAESDQVQALAFMLQCKVQVDMQDRCGNRPLHRAAFRHAFRAAEYLLLHAKAAVNTPTWKGHETPLYVAAGREHAAPGREPSCFLQLLLQAKADVHADGGTRLPLHIAASRGLDSNVRLLLRANAQVAALDCNGLTPLAYAVNGHAPSTVRLLLHAKSSLNGAFAAAAFHRVHQVRRSGFVGSPLHLAVLLGAAAVVRVLLHAKADADAVDSAGWTPYDYAADYCAEMVDALRRR